MMQSEPISSPHNSRIKETVALLEKSRLRRERALFAVEGRRELEQCVEAGYRIRSVFFNPRILPEAELGSVLARTGSAREALCHAVTPEVYAKIAYREGTEGVVAVAEAKDHSPERITLPSDPLVLAVEKVEKPGNLGALLRTADACGADAVLVCDPLTDLYNPNLIRASLGAIFTCPIAVCSNEQALEWLRRHRIAVFTAQLQDSRPYYGTDMTGPCAIVMGSEARGLTDFWREAADARISIPMRGRLDSLNVSVSAAVLCYEAVRQRIAHGNARFTHLWRNSD